MEWNKFRQIRMAKFENEAIDKLWASYKRGGKEMVKILLQEKTGLGDFIPGYDSGEGPRGADNFQ